MRRIRQPGKKTVELSLQRNQLRLDIGKLRLDAIHVGEDWRGVFALGLGLPDALAAAVALGLQLLGFTLQALAARLEFGEARKIEMKATPREFGGDDFRQIGRASCRERVCQYV